MTKRWKGKRVSNFVGEHHARDRYRGQRIEPFDARGQCPRAKPTASARWRARRSALTSRMQVAVWQLLELGQARQQAGGQPPGAGAQFQHIAADGLQYRRTLVGQAAGKQSRQLRRRHEIPRRTEFDAAGRVVAQARCIQHDAQIIVERQPAAMRGDGVPHRLTPRRANARACQAVSAGSI